MNGNAIIKIGLKSDIPSSESPVPLMPTSRSRRRQRDKMVARSGDEHRHADLLIAVVILAATSDSERINTAPSHTRTIQKFIKFANLIFNEFLHSSIFIWDLKLLRVTRIPIAKPALVRLCDMVTAPSLRLIFARLPSIRLRNGIHSVERSQIWIKRLEPLICKLVGVERRRRKVSQASCLFVLCDV